MPVGTRAVENSVTDVGCARPPAAAPAPPGWRLAFATGVEDIRDGIDSRIRAAIPGDAGSIASALITGKAFAAGVRSLIQGVVVVVIATILGVSFTHNPLKLIGAAIVLVMGSAFFACLSMSIAGVALARDRLMGIGQMITMPLFFASNALYPVASHSKLRTSAALAED